MSSYNEGGLIMYTIVNSVCKVKNGINTYLTLDKLETESIICSNIFNFCSELIINIYTQYNPERLSLKLSLIKEQIQNQNITLAEFLTNNGNNALPTEKGSYGIHEGIVKYSDGFNAKYKAIPTNRTIHHTVDILREHKTDLLLKKNNLDYREFYNYCLVSVNGFFHFTELDINEGIFVLNGNRSRQLCLNNVFGIHSFSDVGKIKTVPITENMLHKLSGKEDYSEGIIVKLEEDISNKSIVLILGGYQYIVDNKTISYLNDNCIQVNIHEMFLLEKYHESRNFIDLSSLPLFKNPRSPSQVSISEMYSDDNIKAYFTLPEYSFIVIVDANELSVENIAIRKTHCPNMYIAYENPIYPIYNGTGKVVDFICEIDEGQWAITCIDGYYHNRQYDTVDLSTEKTVGDNRLTQNPVVHSLAYFQKLKYCSFKKI